MTIDYYNKYSKEFIENTLHADMTELYQFFEHYLRPTAKKILDIGFGSGRDSLYFSQKYEVVSIDNSEAFVHAGKELLDNEVLLMDIRNMNFSNEFDGIWACASLLHLSYDELSTVFNKCYNALKDGGIMYASFKYGEFEGVRNDRYFTDLNEVQLQELLNQTQFILKEIKLTSDVRENRQDEKWLNIILSKN
jgi:cyclopropane fatty-acyl-phospholipid synthase-like methyltransferase